MRILIVEDEPGIFNFLKQGLEEETYVVAIAGDGNKKINFNWDMEAGAEVPHYCSNPILDKVISNAIKYSKDNGSISIRISQNNRLWHWYKKAAEAIGATIKVENEPNLETTFTISFLRES